MTEAFWRGDDLHKITAARVSGKRPEEVTKDRTAGCEGDELRLALRHRPIQANAERLGRLRRQALDKRGARAARCIRSLLPRLRALA